MNEHDEIRDLLTLAAAGGLDPAAERRVEAHLNQCAACRSEFESWQQLTGALKRLPTPQAPMGLVERTRRNLQAQAAARAEHRRKWSVLSVLIVLAWMFSFLSWVVFQMLGGKLAQAFDISSAAVTMAWIGYTMISWLMTSLVAAALGKRHQQEGRTA
jgi:anti-sigma factor RsiW